MRAIVGTELERLKVTQESSFFDECAIGVYSGAVDSFGDIQKSWIYSSGISCGFQMVGGNKKPENELLTVLNIDAVVRLPLETEVTSQDRVMILKRNSVVVDAMQFEIKNIGRGVSCLTVLCTNLEV